MAWAAGTAQHRFDAPFDVVYDAAMASIADGAVVARLVSHNRALGRIVLKTSVSWFSWGENVTLAIDRVDESTTAVAIDSRLAMGTNFLAGGRHEKNFSALLSAIQDRLGRASQKDSVLDVDGGRYVLGHTLANPSYYIWDKQHPGSPMARFPYTERGKSAADARHSELEGSSEGRGLILPDPPT